MKTKKLVTTMVSMLMIFSACNKDSLKETEALCNVEFQLAIDGTQTGLQSLKSVDSVTNLKYALVSIADAKGDLVYEHEKLELINFNEKFLSKKIWLEAGKYSLTEFLILDSSDNVVYATPKEGSKHAGLVSAPLAIDFSVGLSQTTTVSPEVLSVGNYSPVDFGYTEFGFRFIKTFNFAMSIYTFDVKEEVIPDSANFSISANGKEYYNELVGGTFNFITINDGLSEYVLRAEKTGYKTYEQTFTAGQLKEYTSTPLDIYLEKNSGITIDYTKIQDATISDYYPDRNYANSTFISAFSWTFEGGNPANTRILMNFDLSQVAEGTQIKSAKLHLFYADNHPDSLHKNYTGGDNQLKIEPIEQTWDVATVTWNNQPGINGNIRVYVPADSNGKVDKTIDITSLVQFMINYPAQAHGIKMSLKDEIYYKSSFFASTKNELIDKRPYITIEL